ncbi:hypothetical protein YQE_07767, partial [Dendroctonus ponderosae]
MESGVYSSYGRPGTTSTLDRHFSRPQQPNIPARSLSTQHITSSALSNSRSPSMRRMRQLLDLDSSRAGAAPSPVPTPSGTLPRGQRQLDINPAEFLKYKIEKPGNIAGLTQLGAGKSATPCHAPLAPKCAPKSAPTAQTLSKSVSDALLCLSEDLTHPKFKDAKATANFAKNIQ